MSATPIERKGLMPPQQLRLAPSREQGKVASARWRRIMVVSATLLLAGWAGREMWRVFAAGGVTWPEYLVLVLFCLTFTPIALAFVTALAGFAVQRWGQRPAWISTPLSSRTVVLMPCYNEDPARICAAIEAMAEAVVAAGEGTAFDWFLIADSNDPEVLLQEERCFLALRQRLAGRARVYYRRRRDNHGRKAGNVADFCRRWGRHYQQMLVLDADSLMSADTLIQLARRMEAAPQTALIQTIPTLIRGQTPLARLQQFATRLYGPVVATGLGWWVHHDGNFWGHNAIIRTEAFMAHAGLPTLPGKAPFGGHIMSHDFVEAALLRRAGWAVDIAWDLDGSYEESPPSLIDMAVRDRRWCQGNLQHAKVLPAHGLSWVSRLHMVTGILSYLSSPLWLLLVLAGFALAMQAQFIRPEYFPDSFSLFPAWPVLDSERALRLFGITMAVLFGPKLLGLMLALMSADKRRQFGGSGRLLLSSGLEVLLSALVAPVMMLIHTGAVASVILGADSGWHAQRRDDGSLPWQAVWRRHQYHVLVGLVLAVAAYFNSWQLLAWLSPALAGLLLAVPLSYYSGDAALGRRMSARGWLQIPEESTVPAIESAMLARLADYQARRAEAPTLALLAADSRQGQSRLALIDTVASRAKGQASAMEALVRLKLSEAADAAEALTMLDKAERAWMLSTPDCYAQWLALADEPAQRSL
ncbi:glucans biosynthesis glucosyltransferase MdoH [Gallaecimonas sp. GXIMD1310]|uniref:glucans biosynthesis glucosyltransferase MdoH n=1 Tax=Gallaecimonas sp. GXIMD1310 TaxID=3131926 RepID=UPI003249A163